MVPKLPAWAVLVSRLKATTARGGGGRGGIIKITTTTVRGEKNFIILYGTTTPNGSLGGHWFTDPPFSCGPVRKFHFQYDFTVLEVSLPGLVLRYYMDVGFYISLHSKYKMVLGSEVICTIEYATGTGQGFCG